MSRFTRSPSPAYRAFVTSIQEYADDDQEPGETVTRAIADALSDELRERFKDYWEVDRQAEVPCLWRLITRENECTCERSGIDQERERIGSPGKPPHSPPYAAHATLWLDDGKPVLYSMHPSPPHTEPQRNGWFELGRFAQHWGLEIAVMPVSWYKAFSTVNIVFSPPEREQTRSISTG